jgi:biopolymer transport protein ExbB
MEFGRFDFLIDRGGPAIWAIVILSFVALTVALWKVWRLSRMGAWSRRSEDAVADWVAGDFDMARKRATASEDSASKVAAAAMLARATSSFSDAQAREETERVAKLQLAQARSGLRILDLTVTIAPLLGLLGTVLGMIDAFQALQAEGAAADAATLAGGIWQALLTTAAGMSVAIPASVVLTWFESVIESLQTRMEDAATRIFTSGQPA